MEKIEFDDFDYISLNEYKPFMFASTTVNNHKVFVDKYTKEIFYEVPVKKNYSFEDHCKYFEQVLTRENIDYIKGKDFLCAPINWIISYSKRHAINHIIPQLKEVKKNIMGHYLMKNSQAEAEG